MPKLSDHHSSQITKLLLMGDSGSGKTGALASLALAGYSLYIVDFDNGLDALKDVLKDKPDALARVEFETCTDAFKFSGSRAVPMSARAWPKMTEALTKWQAKGLGPQDIVVVDSLDHGGDAAMRHYLNLQNRLASLPKWQDWKEPQQMIEDLIAMLTSSSLACNVIIISHITIMGEQMTERDTKSGEVVKVTRPGTERGYPSALGKALSPHVGSYFNAVLLSRSISMGDHAPPVRKIFTDSRGIIELKNSAPTSVKPDYPMTTGLADYFVAVRSQPAKPTPAPPSVATQPQGT